MSESNLILCKYRNHLCTAEEFTPSGLNNKCYKICRKCNVDKVRKSRQKHREKYNISRREYNRQWKANKRAQNRTEIIC